MAQPNDLDPSSFQAGTSVAGFKLLRVERVPEIDSVARLFLHEKSGAQLLYLSNSDTNKVFSISFRTPPNDNTGIAHILEHSVLCGSRKFPSKEPFIELLKGSLTTFLNAFTSTDWTMYPVASKNDKDFVNLLDVYMDAVFYPNLLTNAFILMQEGWHYDVDSRTNRLSYNGVVYNEMKGVFSDVERLIEMRTQNALFPDNTYAYVSGGDPSYIPQLTQEQFVGFHKQFYSPANCLIYFYGNGNVQEHLTFLDKEYLSCFDKMPVNSAISLQQPFAHSTDTVVNYSINQNDKPADKTFLSYSFVLGHAYDAKEFLSFEILKNILVDNEAAPLKRALLEAHLGRDVKTVWNTNIQPNLTIYVTDTNLAEKARFCNVIETTLESLATNGIDKELVESMIAKKELELHELERPRFPKGLYINMDLIMPAWIYDRDPLTHIKYSDTLAAIKEAAKDRYFERLIKEYLLENNHKAIVSFVPVPGLQSKEDEALQNRLLSFNESLSSDKIEKIKADTSALKANQSKSDTAEVLSKIPMLSLPDISPQAELLPINAGTAGGTTYLTHPMSTNGIVYFTVFCDTSRVPSQLLPYIGLLNQALGKLSTKHYAFMDLDKAVNKNGLLKYDTEVVSDKSSLDKIHPKIIISATVLGKHLAPMFDLIREVSLETQFTDKARLKEIVKEAYAATHSQISGGEANLFALRRASSYFCNEGVYSDAVKGIEYFKFLADLEKHYDEKAEEVGQNLKLISDLIFTKDNLLVSFASDQKTIDSSKELVASFVERYPKGSGGAGDLTFNLEKKNEAFIIPSQVNYVAMAGNFRILGFDYNGSFNVFNNVMFSDYLWNRIRVIGGAYGGRIQISRPGLIGLVSYRDPNLRETLDNYIKARDYLANFNADQREMTKFVIGAISRLDPALSAKDKALTAAKRFIAEITQEDVQKEREETLKTTAEDIRRFSALIERLNAENNLCVIGGEQKVAAESGLFKSVSNLME